MASTALRNAAYIAVIAIAAGLGIHQFADYRAEKERQDAASRRAKCFDAVRSVETGGASEHTQQVITNCLFNGTLTQDDLDASLARIRARQSN